MKFTLFLAVLALVLSSCAETRSTYAPPTDDYDISYVASGPSSLINYSERGPLFPTTKAERSK